MVYNFLKLCRNKFPKTYLNLYKFYIHLNLIKNNLNNYLKWETNNIKIIFRGESNKKKILGVYDLSYQPYGIGDFIDFNQCTLLRAYDYNIELIDIIIINSKSKLNKSKEFKQINAENSFFFLNSIISVIQLNKKIAQLFIFDNHDSFKSFIISNQDKYILFPSTTQQVQEKYIYKVAFNNIFYNFYKRHNFLLKLELPSYLYNWSISFLSDFDCNGTTFVTVNVRNNPFHALDRNSDLDVWFDFFKYCKNIYNVKFLIICTKSEIDERFRILDNVIIVKDYNTSLEQELALISTSSIHLGTASGPFSIALYSDKPYVMFSWNGDINTHKCIYKNSSNNFQLIFSNKWQQILIQKESLSFLIELFKTYNNNQFIVPTIMNKNSNIETIQTWLK